MMPLNWVVGGTVASHFNTHGGTSVLVDCDLLGLLKESSLLRSADSFQRLLHNQQGRRAEWEYPFAVAGLRGRPTTLAGKRFLELLGEDAMAFDNLYCVAFEMMDAQWLAKRASCMEFNEVLKSRKAQLERELALEDVFSVKDLPAYNLLTG